MYKEYEERWNEMYFHLSQNAIGRPAENGRESIKRNLTFTTQKPSCYKLISTLCWRSNMVGILHWNRYLSISALRSDKFCRDAKSHEWASAIATNLRQRLEAGSYDIFCMMDDASCISIGEFDLRIGFCRKHIGRTRAGDSDNYCTKSFHFHIGWNNMSPISQ